MCFSNSFGGANPLTGSLLQIALGKMPGFSGVYKFGRNATVPNGSWQFVTSLGHTAWPLSAATTVRIKAGGDAADTAAGAGAREVTVQGILADGTEGSEAIATAGASASSATTASFLRVHRAWVSSVGTYGAANTAAITIENSGGGTDLIQIVAGEGQTQFCAYTVPSGHTGRLMRLSASVDSQKTAGIRLMTRNDITDTTAPMSSVRLKMQFDGISGVLDHQCQCPAVSVPELSDIWVEAYGDGAVSAVSAQFNLLLVAT